VEDKMKEKSEQQSKSNREKFEEHVRQMAAKGQKEFEVLSRPQTNSKTAQLGFHGPGEG
jgi:hypothetical protein